jgi:transcription antitermination factor NusG
MLQDFVEVSDNQFDQGKSVVGLGNKKKLNRFQREGQRLLDRIEKEKDEDIKRQLKKGNIVKIIEDSLDY